jgi:DNA-binding NtrC family response regulator/tetratricopeptide (TPR) repeat protein
MSDGYGERLITLGNFREAADWLDSKPMLTPFEQVLKAWVEFELGDARQAYSHAKTLLKTAPDRTSQAYCLAIAGRALGRSGSPHEGLGLIRKAIVLASQNNRNLEAQLLGIFANCLLSWVGLEPAMVELPKVREAATRTGDRRALVEYHIVHARVAVIKGAPQIALDEIERAYNLLDAEPYSDLLWRLRETQSHAALQDGDIEAARQYAEQCLRLAEESRSRRRIANTLGNLAHIASVAGEFRSAKRYLSECLDRMDPQDPARLAALSTGLIIGLATHDESLILELQEQGNHGACDGHIGQSYYGLWFEINRVRYLIDSGALTTALAVAKAATPEVTRLADKELYDRFRLLASEALAKSGNHQQADQAFGRVCAEGRNCSLELVVELLRVGAVLNKDRHAASRALATGLRLLTSAGLLGIRTELERTAACIGISVTEDDRSSGESRFGLVDFGTLLKLGRYPRVLGAELLTILREHPSSGTAYLVEEQDNHTRMIDAIGASVANIGGAWRDGVRIQIGKTSRSTFWLCAGRPLTVGEHQLWATVANIVRAAGALHLLPPEETNKTQTVPPAAPTIQYGMLIAGEGSSDLLATAQKLAPSNITVLITGETGTGKELLARALHDASPRSEKPFIPFNCSAVSRDMLDAQLFGYRKGAFTGANEAFPGVIRAAAGGTLFLDEIGEMTLDVQPKLLRFLESGDIHPLGEPRPIHVDVRIVTATNADLEALVADGRFREDLFYRLNVVPLQVPPLRERREEIPPLVQHFLDKYGREAHKCGIRIADETMEYLVLYRWPGNIRQLANELRRLVALAESNAVLMPEHLSASIAASRRTIPAAERPPAPTEVVVRMDQPMSAAMEHLERSMIQYALGLSSGRVEDAAQRLGLSRKGLYLKRQRLHIESTADERALVDQ